MRKDDEGNPCPGTLGEYLSLCETLGVRNNKAVHFLRKKIQKQGADEEVIAPDSQMRQLLMPLLLQEVVDGE